MKINSFLLIFFATGFLCWGNVKANDVENKAKELSGIKAKIKQVSKAVKNLKSDKKSLLSELKRLEVQYGKNKVYLLDLKTQVKRLNTTLGRNKQQQHIKKQQIKAQKKSLENLVKAAYGMGKHEKLKLMLNQQDPALSGRVMVYYDYFNKTRLEKIAQIAQGLQLLRDLDAQYQSKSELLEKKIAVQKQNQQQLLATKKGRKLVLLKLEQQFKTKNQQLKRFKQSEKKLKALILSLQQAKDDFPLNDGEVKPFAQLKGKLSWPVKGRIIKKFGDRRSESRWDGVLIDAREGQKVTAVTRGQIVYADWLRGYGLLTIIKHDKGYMTLYAFNQSLFKAKGDWVEAGTVISTVGLSGGRTHAGLYFGIRKKGKPVNPQKWCRKIRHGKTW